MGGTEHVALTVPARGEYARTVRLAAAELAVRCGLNVDEVDDVRLAVEEAFVFGCGREPSGGLTFAFSLEPGSMEMLVGPLAKPCTASEDGEAGERYARFILESVCDSYEIVEREGSCYVRLVKRTA
jgi:serine/threonine-protein kinase RsbW